MGKLPSTKEIELYMVLGKNNSVFRDIFRNNIMAVNLSTGQIRAFSENQKVEPVDAEVNFPK